MNKKMTISEFRAFIQEKALTMYTEHLNEAKKTELENKNNKKNFQRSEEKK